MVFVTRGLRDATVCVTGVVPVFVSVLFTMLAFAIGLSLSSPVLKRSRIRLNQSLIQRIQCLCVLSCLSREDIE